MFWKLILNVGKISRVFFAIKKCVEDIVKDKKSLPSKESVLDLFESIQTILVSHVIDIPGVDEDALASSLDEFKQVVIKNLEVKNVV